MKSIADAFADRMDGIINNLMKGINAADFNPVSCCVCAVLDLDGKVEAVVRGYGVCTWHILAVDQGGNIKAALKLIGEHPNGPSTSTRNRPPHSSDRGRTPQRAAAS